MNDINPSNPFEKISGYLEASEYPTILDTVGDDVHAIEMQWNHRDPTRATVVVKHELYEESFCLKYQLNEGVHQMTIHQVDNEHNAIFFEPLVVLEPLTIFFFASEAITNGICRNQTQNGFFDKETGYADN